LLKICFDHWDQGGFRIEGGKYEYAYPESGLKDKFDQILVLTAQSPPWIRCAAARTGKGGGVHLMFAGAAGHESHIFLLVVLLTEL